MGLGDGHGDMTTERVLTAMTAEEVSGGRERKFLRYSYLPYLRYTSTVEARARHSERAA